MVRENGQWKLLSLGLLLLDLPSLEEEWDKAEIAVNEKSAIANLKEIAEAVEAYRKRYTRLPESLGVMGPPADGQAKADKAGLLGEELSGGRKEGYIFRYVIVGASTSGAPAKYELAAIPAEYGRSGSRSFFRDSAGSCTQPIVRVQSEVSSIQSWSSAFGNGPVLHSITSRP